MGRRDGVRAPRSDRRVEEAKIGELAMAVQPRAGLGGEWKGPCLREQSELKTFCLVPHTSEARSLGGGLLWALGCRVASNLLVVRYRRRCHRTEEGICWRCLLRAAVC